jgi:hypothetical protein
MMLALVLWSAATAAQSDAAAPTAEQRALDAERRAVAAERRAAEFERRALEAENSASAGSGQASSQLDARACQEATANYEFVCSYPSRNGIGDAPPCAAAQAEMRLRCGG